MRLIFWRSLSRRTKILLAIVVVLAVLGLAHVPILRLLAWPLQARNDSLEADYFCLHGGELGVDGVESFARAVRWQAAAPGRKILLIEPPDSRIVEAGVPSFAKMCRNELKKSRKKLEEEGKTPAIKVVSIQMKGRGVCGEAHALAGWLKENPDKTVVLACSAFSSGRQRYVFDKVLGPGDAARVRLTLSSEPPDLAERWWLSRGGVKEFMYAWLGLIYAWAEGDNVPEAPKGAANFQKDIREQIGEAHP